MRQTGSHLHCAVLGSPWDRLGSVSVPLILRFTNSPFLWSRPPVSAQGRVRVPRVKSGEILPGRLSLSHQEPLMPPHSCPWPLPLSLWLGLSLQILARGHEGHHGAPRRHLLLLIRAGGGGGQEWVAGAARVIWRATRGQPISCRYQLVAASGTGLEASYTSSWGPGLRALDGGKPWRVTFQSQGT